jgi:hypothetical protein
MHVWLCDAPSTMKIPILLRRLQEDIPPCRYNQIGGGQAGRSQYLIDSP